MSSQDDPKAVSALKYMLLCKIMLSLPEDVASIMQGKLAQKYAGKDVEAMRAVAKAHEDRSLAAFETALREHKHGTSEPAATHAPADQGRAELSDDPIIRNHLASLYDTLLEQNLLRIIEPFSRVEIAYVATKVNQPVRDVENKYVHTQPLGAFCSRDETCLSAAQAQPDDPGQGLPRHPGPGRRVPQHL